MTARSAFPVADVLSDSDREAGLRFVVRDGMASQAMASLTGSAILVAFAVQLGASNALIGLLAAIPQLGQLMQLPAVGIVRRFRNRRFITVVASTIGRLAWVPVALSPLFLSRTGVLTVLVTGLLIASVMAAVANCAWNSWMHDLVPQNQLGVFFGRRFSLATFTGTVVSLSAGLFIDHLADDIFANEVYAYSVVFGVGVVFGLIGLAFIAQIPESRYEPNRHSVFEAIRKPFADAEFRNLIHFLAAWNFAMYLATPFFSVYMLRRLEMNLTWVIGLIVVGRLVNILLLRVWGKFSDRIGNKSVLALSTPLCLLCVLGWTFTTLPDKHALTIPLLVVLHILMGVAMAGITLAMGNIGLRMAPRDEGVGYLAATNFVAALAAGLAPIMAGRVVDFFVDRRLAWTINYDTPSGATTIELVNLQQWDFLFLLSFVLGLYAVHRLSLVKEPGEAGEKIVVVELISAIGREVREFSTVGAIRNVMNMIPLRNEFGKPDPPSDV